MAEGDGCVRCGHALEIIKTVEVGHIFKLGYRYSERWGCASSAQTARRVTPIMGSYGIGIERILSAAIELYNDKDGIVLPPAIAPFDVVVTPVTRRRRADEAAAESIYREALAAGPRCPAR